MLAVPSQSQAFESYHQVDLQKGLSAPLAQQFDRILLLDVLEHMLHPEELLDEVRPLLRQGGQVIVSVPNVANISVRLLLLLGNFDYTERGILDRTHLHLYTRKTARMLLEGQGFEILEERLTLIPVELAFRLPHTNWLMLLCNRLLGMLTAVLPGLFGYQIMFRAAALGLAPTPPPLES